jgi:hypothetical protein
VADLRRDAVVERVAPLRALLRRVRVLEDALAGMVRLALLRPEAEVEREERPVLFARARGDLFAFREVVPFAGILILPCS